MDAEGLLALIEAGDYDSTLRQLRAAPDDEALKLIESVRKVGDPEVRLWISWAAPQRLGGAAAPLLRDMALHDRHPDVADEARGALLELEPERAAEFWGLLRRRLKSTSLRDAELAGWQLFRLGDPLVKEELEGALLNWPEHYYIHKSFGVLGWCLEGRSDIIMEHIRAHDHEPMKWLTRAAIYLASDELWSTVKWMATNAPDERCRWDCANALKYHPGRKQARPG